MIFVTHFEMVVIILRAKETGEIPDHVVKMHFKEK